MFGLSRKNWVLFGLLLVLVAGGFAFLRNGESRPGYRTAKVERGDITAVVSAVGKVNAVVSVQVGSQVTGRIQRLFVDFNSRVRAGQVIAQIDPTLFEAQVEQAKAKLANDEAHHAKARAALEDAKRKLDRVDALFARGFIAQSERETAETAYNWAVADLRAAETQVEQDRAALKIAQTNLQYTTILSPINGIVISRNVDVGQTVAASLQAPTLLTLAQDLTEMKVDTSVDEADIGTVAVGQEAEFAVDAYPETAFRGTVHDIYNQPVVLQNVVTYDAIVRVKNPDMKLKPGMTANVRITVGRRENAIKLPNAALRYRPEEAQPQRGAQQGPAVWLLHEGKEAPVRLKLGLSDGVFSEVLSGGLQPGDEVILEKIRKAAPTGSGRPPGFRGGF